MNFIISQKAGDDITCILEYIRSDDEYESEKFAQKLDKKFDILREFPEIGVTKTQYGEQVRMMIFGAYNIYYENNKNELVILRVLRSSQGVGAKIL